MSGRLASGPISMRPFSTTLRDVRAAGPARPAVDGHGAAAAHADAAGEAIGERGIGVALHPRHDVEHGLVVAQRHAIGLIAAVRPCRARAKPRSSACHAAYLTVTRTRCTTLLPKPPASQRVLERLRLAVGIGRAAGQARARRAPRSTSQRQPRQANVPRPADRARPSCQTPSTPTSTRAIGTPPPDQARPNNGHLARLDQPRRVYQSGMPGGTSSDFTRMCVTGVRRPIGHGAIDDSRRPAGSRRRACASASMRVQPLHARHAVPAGHDQAQRKAVLRQQRRAVHGPHHAARRRSAPRRASGCGRSRARGRGRSRGRRR